jgi:transposase
MRMVPALRITGDERKELERRARSDRVSRRPAQRAQIVLLAAEGVSNREIARLVGLNQNQVGMWRKRYAALGVIGLEDRPRPGRPRRTRVLSGDTPYSGAD